MIEKSSKADQIRKLREARVLASEKAAANCEDEAAADNDSAPPKQKPKASSR